MNGLGKHHLAWLDCHPARDAVWLKARLADGFHVHHIDGNHDNNSPQNLILVDEVDHARLHGESPFMLSSLRVVSLEQAQQRKQFRRIYRKPAGPSGGVYRYALALRELDKTPEAERNSAYHVRHMLAESGFRDELTG